MNIGAATRVLCVDDNRDAADSAAALLTLADCEVHACYDGAAALDDAKKFRPAVCFIDLDMPGMAGDEVARRMAKDVEGKPLLVALTAMDDGAAASGSPRPASTYTS
jgi:CheY-like chemotaxis protein